MCIWHFLLDASSWLIMGESVIWHITCNMTETKIVGVESGVPITPAHRLIIVYSGDHFCPPTGCLPSIPKTSKF